jgi:hypothetical protein
VHVVVGLAVVGAVLAFVLAACPSYRDGMSGQLAAAKEDTVSAARSGALAIRLWARHRSTRDLTCVQLSDARDEVVKAYDDIATLTADNPDDLSHQRLLAGRMTDLAGTLDEANAAVRAVAGLLDPQAVVQRLVDGADALERDYR